MAILEVLIGISEMMLFPITVVLVVKKLLNQKKFRIKCGRFTFQLLHVKIVVNLRGFY